jgi:hypothetical protein
MLRKFTLLYTCLFLGLLHQQASADILGTAQPFAVLAGSAVTNTGPTVIAGDLGVWPGSAITGFPPGLVTGGTTHTTDAVAMQAQLDVTTAYNTLAGMAVTQNLTGQDLGGLTLTPGVYFYSTSAQLTGTLTLDTLGNPNAMFVFQIGSTLTTASNSRVATIHGPDDCHIYWQVGSSATLGTGTSFQGNILALASITLNTGANILDGRALARNGAVTLDNIHVVAGCPCLAGPASLDCNANGVPDECEIANGGTPDCNQNGIPDSCDIQSGSSLDCNGNGIPDECDLPGTLPSFTTCLERPVASVGAMLTFQVCANGGTPGNPITLNVNSLPPGATMTPPLPLTGDSVCSTFHWTPTIGQVGAPVLEFEAVGANGCRAGCKMRILVVQTLMLFGGGYGSSQFTMFGHQYDTQLTSVRRAFPVSPENMPNPLFDALPLHYSVQVVAYSVLVFPQHPSRWSYLMEFTRDLATQTVSAVYHGNVNGIDLAVQTFTDTNGQLRVRFPFHIQGL